jgi:hypothetical protein
VAIALLSRFLPRYRSVPTTRKTPAVTCFRPGVEGLESRVVPSAASLARPALNAAIEAAAQPQVSQSFPLDITALRVVTTDTGPQLLATLSLAGKTIQDVPIDVTLQQTAVGECPILHLALGPIDLNVLGLNISLDNCDNGPITVDISAEQGPGNLLGNLLCGLTGSLDGLNLGGLLDRLTDQLGDLTTAINQLNTALTDQVLPALNQILDQLTDLSGATGLTPTSHLAQGSGHTCDILNLEVNEIHLDLLGLQVDTSDICLDVTAQRGPGNLLGNLLCGLSHALDNGALDLGQVIGRIGRIIDRVL